MPTTLKTVRIIFRTIGISIAIIFGLLFFLSATAKKANGQVIDLACPAGTQSLQPLQTTTPAGHIRQNFCADASGNLISNGSSIPATAFTNIGTGTDSGAANAYVATVNFPTGMGPTISGSQFTMKVNNSNTAASTINVNGAGVVALQAQNLFGLTGGELTAGIAYTFINVGSGNWLIVGSKQGNPSLPTSQVSAVMAAPLGNNGGSSLFVPSIVIFTPFMTGNAFAMRNMLSIQCVGNGSSGCNGGPSMFLGYDSDGVAIFNSGNSQSAFVSPTEQFSENDQFGSGTASSIILNVSDNGHSLHTSGRVFGVTDKNARIMLDISATAANSLLTMAEPVAIGVQSISGCSLSAAVGGAWAGKFVSGTTGTCTVTITFPDTATNGWACGRGASDITTTADFLTQTAFTTTTATLSGTTASGDTIVWGPCVGF